MDKIETVVFDLGNVLVNWDPRNLYRKVFSSESEMEFFLENVCNGSWNAEQDRGRRFEDAIKIKQIAFPKYHKEIELYHSRWDEMLGGEISETVNILTELYKDRKCRLYALTNWSTETFPIAIDRFDFLQMFEGIVVSGREGLIKPDREIYELLLNRFDINPRASVFIDDSLVNVEAAKTIGMKAIHFVNAEQLATDLNRLAVLV